MAQNKTQSEAQLAAMKSEMTALKKKNSELEALKSKMAALEALVQQLMVHAPGAPSEV